MEGTSKNVKPSKQRKMVHPIKFCSILSVMLGATSFLVVVEASQASQGSPTTKTFEARMTVNETYEPGYSNSSSAKFKTFATNFNKTVGEFLSKKLFGFERVEVKKLASGSVVVDFDIVLLKSSNATVDVIVQALEAGNASELGYTILGNVNVNATDQQSTSSIPSPTATVAAGPGSGSPLPSTSQSPLPSSSSPPPSPFSSVSSIPSASTSPSTASSSPASLPVSPLTTVPSTQSESSTSPPPSPSPSAAPSQSTSALPSPPPPPLLPTPSPKSTSALRSPSTSPSPSTPPQSTSALPSTSTSPSPSTTPQSTSALLSPSTSPTPSTSPQSTSALSSPPTSPSRSPSPQSTSALPSPFPPPSLQTPSQLTSALPSPPTSPSPSASQSTSALPSPSPPPSLPTPPPQSKSASPSPSPSPSLPTPPPPPALSTSTPSSFPSSSLSALLPLHLSTTTPVPSKTRQSITPSTDVPTEGSKEFKGSGSIDNEWNSDYASSSTPAYKRLSGDLKDHLTAVLKKSYEDSFIGVDVANFREGSVKFDFTVYLKATTIVNEETLKDVIQKGEGGSNFTITEVTVKQIAGPKPTTSTTDVPTEGSKEFKGSGSIDNEWDSDYANNSTPAYKRLYSDLKDHLTAVLKKSYEDSFIGVEVANFREGSIKFDFTVFLKATTIVNEETLKDVIQKGEGGSNFTITGVTVKQFAGPKPTTSTTEKPEAESGLEKWKIVLIATLPVIVILVIALLVVVHQNRRLSSMHKRDFPVSDYSRSVPARMYSASANTKEMYQLTGHGAENAGSRISRGLTTFSPDNEDLNGTSNRAFVKMEGDKSERDNQSLDRSKSDASDKDSVRYSSGVDFI